MSNNSKISPATEIKTEQVTIQNKCRKIQIK